MSGIGIVGTGGIVRSAQRSSSEWSLNPKGSGFVIQVSPLESHGHGHDRHWQGEEATVSCRHGGLRAPIRFWTVRPFFQKRTVPHFATNQFSSYFFICKWLESARCACWPLPLPLVLDFEARALTLETLPATPLFFKGDFLLLDASEASASSGFLVQSGIVLGQQVLAHLGKVKVAVVLRGSLV